MDTPGSISAWVGRLKAGDAVAVEPLWRAYFIRLVELARRQLGACPRAAADEEDAALSAFNSFCRRAQAGRFPDLNDRHDLWQILFMLTTRKAIDLKRGEVLAKRGGGRVRHASAVATDAGKDAFAEITGHEPTPDQAAQMTEECRLLLDGLGDAELRAVAVAKMEGYSNAEIGVRVGKSLATVERKLRLIRKTWQRELGA
jgi:DNA-directed RNA polymerase specialized sigma24 family protein